MRDRARRVLALQGTEASGTHGVTLLQGSAGLAWVGLAAMEDDGSDLLLLRP